MINDKTFGSFIAEKRIEKDITLRGFAKLLDLSPVYISNIENGRKPAPTHEVLERIALVLILTKEEQELMYDLAAKSKNAPTVSNDLQEYIMNNDIVRVALRTAKDLDITDEKWQDFIEKLELFTKEQREIGGEEVSGGEELQ